MAGRGSISGLASQWSSQYDGLKRALISRRSTGIPLTRDEIQGHSLGLDRLHAQLRTMTGAPEEHGLAASEIARREVLLDNLRAIMLKGSPPAPTSAASSFSSVQPNSVYNPSDISTKGLSVQREMALKEQDAIISQIGTGVDRLFMQAVTIGEEASIHSRLLDSLDDNVEVTQRALKEEAKHAELIREKSRSFYLYLCIAFEIIVLVLLAIMWAMNK